LTVPATTSYVCCALRPVIASVIFFGRERPELATLRHLVDVRSTYQLNRRAGSDARRRDHARNSSVLINHLVGARRPSRSGMTGFVVGDQVPLHGSHSAGGWQQCGANGRLTQRGDTVTHSTRYGRVPYVCYGITQIGAAAVGIACGP